MRCRWCWAWLVDADGEPRWDLFAGPGALAFVCRDRCPPPRPLVARYSRLGDPHRPLETTTAPVLAGATP